ncbi:MAG: M48 family metalloprotease [Candidatus ainarchaeum sp.]|nr:M48 family metalloprotease [Candidatus ainarchaeum sp.]
MDKVNIFDAIEANKRNSIILILLMSGLLFLAVAATGYLFGFNEFGIIFALFITAIYVFFAYGAGAQTILSISGARQLADNEEPFLQNVVEGLAIAAGVPKPKIWVMEDPGMNAFATGMDPKNSHIVFTRGLLKNMGREELEGVAAHEMSHIGNYDIRFATLAVVMVGAIALIGEFGWRFAAFGGRRDERRGGNGVLLILALIFAILAPIFATLVKFALSRQREYLADANAAKLTRYPAGLASALEKISGHASVAGATSTTASLYIADPLKKSMLTGLFATHPPVEDRIKRLKAM